MNISNGNTVSPWRLQTKHAGESLNLCVNEKMLLSTIMHNRFLNKGLANVLKCFLHSMNSKNIVM